MDVREVMDVRKMIHKAWPDWEIVKLLGEGSFGRVYEVERRDLMGVSSAAIKIITIPQKESEINSLYAEGYTPDQTRTYLEKMVKGFGQEIRLMEAVKGTTNIVSIEDYAVIEEPEILKWHILIRMELLTPLYKYTQMHPLGEQDILQLGVDLCSALSVCRQRNIVHRDIKPENVFVNDYGDFKLGDFGVARTMERLTAGFTRTGTYDFMAPEVFNNSLTSTDISAASKVDIYSLGMVLYYLCNKNRIAFVPTEEMPDPSARSEALIQRMRGDSLPAPKNASKDFTRIILKACAFDPQNRYSSAEEMRLELMRLLNPPYKTDNQPIYTTTGTVRMDAPSTNNDSQRFTPIDHHTHERDKIPQRKSVSDSIPSKKDDSPNKSKKTWVVIAVAIVALCLTGTYLIFGNRLSPSPSSTTTESTDTSIPTASPELSAVPTATRNQVEFSDSRVESAVLASLEKTDGIIYQDELEKVTTLKLGETGLTDLSDLAKLPNLRKLHLYKNGIRDISALEGLTQLEGLELSGNEISDISPLSGLTNLKTLSLIHNQVNDLSPLASLNQLKRLYLMSNRIDDISALASLGELRELDIQENDDIRDLSPLTSLTKLEKYSGPECAWPTGSDKVILGVFPEGTDSTMAEAFTAALAQANVQTYATVMLNREYSAMAWKYFLENSAQDRRVEAICLLPFEDVDYSEAKAKAVQNGCALHILSAQTPKQLFDEVCSLYGLTGVNNPY